MGSDYYFLKMEKEQRKLKEHGFDHYPNERELVDYAFSIEDRVEALCEHMNVKLAQDVRGCWHALERKDENLQW